MALPENEVHVADEGELPSAGGHLLGRAGRAARAEAGSIRRCDLNGIMRCEFDLEAAMPRREHLSTRDSAPLFGAGGRATPSPAARFPGVTGFSPGTDPAVTGPHAPTLAGFYPTLRRRFSMGIITGSGSAIVTSGTMLICAHGDVGVVGGLVFGAA